MAKIPPNIFEWFLNSPDRHLAGEMMALMVSGKVKSEKEAKEKAELNYAVQTEDDELLKTLLKNGASPNDPAFQDCLLTRAVRFGKIKSVKILLAHDANPNYRIGCPPLLQAVSNKNVEAARLLISAGAEVNFSMPDDQPELLLACLGNQLEMVELLLANGAKTNLHGTIYITNKREVRKATPLMMAAWQGKPSIVKCLLAVGADVHAKDSEGCTAVDWAERNSVKKSGLLIKEMLEQAGGIQGNSKAPELFKPPDFREAAKNNEYKKLVRELSEVTGVKAQRLEGSEESIAGGFVFSLHAHRVKTIVTQLQSRFLAAGTFIFATEMAGTCLAVLPTDNPLQAVAAMETAGPNSNVDTDMVIEWLKALDEDQSYQLIGVGGDFVQGRFREAVKDPMAIAQRIAKLCPDAEETAKSLAAAASHIAKTQEFFLWWD